MDDRTRNYKTASLRSLSVFLLPFIGSRQFAISVIGGEALRITGMQDRVVIFVCQYRGSLDFLLRFCCFQMLHINIGAFQPIWLWAVQKSRLDYTWYICDFPLVYNGCLLKM